MTSNDDLPLQWVLSACCYSSKRLVCFVLNPKTEAVSYDLKCSMMENVGVVGYGELSWVVYLQSTVSVCESVLL